MVMTVPSGSVRLWAVAPADACRWSRRWPNEPVEWCYFGTDSRRRTRVATRLSQAKAIQIGDDLSRIAHTLRQPFLDWIAAIGAQQVNSQVWWALKMASKSPLQTDLFLLVCYSQLFREWVSRADQRARRIVIIEDPWLLAVLRQHHANDPQVSVPSIGRYRLLLDVAYWLARMPLCIGYTLQWALRSMVLARLWFPTRSERPNEQDHDVVWIYTWIDDRCFSTPGALQDVYTGRLGELLSRHGQRVKWLTPLKMATRDFWRLRGVASKVVVSPRVLQLVDLWRALRMRARVDRLSAHARCQGCDYTLLLHRELLREWGDPAFALYQLWYVATKRLAGQQGRRVKLLIYPFENQPWEKLLCLAFKQEAPRTRLIGYQHATVSVLELNYFPTRAEWGFAPLPDQIVTNGPWSLELLRCGGYPSGRLVDGGALRYEYLLTAQRHTRGRTRAGGGPYRILVAVPSVPVQGESLFRALVEEFQQPFLDDRDRSPVEFIVKCHPLLPLTKLVSPSARLPAWFRISERPLRELFGEVDLCLYAPPGVSRWEAYFSGLPVLKYRSEWLDMDSVDGFGEDVVPSCSRQTLRPALAALLTANEHTSAPTVHRAVSERFFSPVDERLWLRLAGQATAMSQRDIANSEACSTSARSNRQEATGVRP